MRQNFRPPTPQRVSIDGPAGVLEARVEDPASDQSPLAVGVVCHPHPLYGGTLQNKVVHPLARAMQELGVPTLRFNFRGVAASAGAYDGGVGEIEDAVAVCAWARSRWSQHALWLAGFSFGAAVALQAAPLVRPRMLVTVAPPVGRLIVTPIPPPGCPWLVVQGDRDELVDFAAVRAWISGQSQPPVMLVLNDAEHFFHGRLGELRAGVIEFLSGASAT